MILGLDLDNTIVRYDALFHALAVEEGLVPVSTPAAKTAVRDLLRRTGKEKEWTRLQGLAYGPRMADAEPFPRALQCLERLQRSGTPVKIISHRTLHPVEGPSFDLHEAARSWIEKHGLQWIPLFLETSKKDKLRRIQREGCSHFMDDLPEFLTMEGFPSSVESVLFDPWNQFQDARVDRRFIDWKEVTAWLKGA